MHIAFQAFSDIMRGSAPYISCIARVEFSPYEFECCSKVLVNLWLGAEFYAQFLKNYRLLNLCSKGLGLESHGQLDHVVLKDDK